MSEWQPIETAPRDGTVVLLWAKPNYPHSATHGVTFGRWEENKHERMEVVRETFDESGRVTQKEYALVGRANGFWSYDDRSFTPTHWMPLPAPPSPTP